MSGPNAFTRRAFGAGALAALRAQGAPPRRFRFAALADTHIIDGFYRGPEGNALDTKTIFEANGRLERVRAFLNSLDPPLDAVFIAGDFFHNYPSEEREFYSKDRTRLDIARDLAAGFKAKVYPGFGNHDYAVPRISREFSHALFAEKFGVQPYYSVELHGFRFIHLNNFLGATWDRSSAEYKLGTGSFGEEQLNWFEAELRRRQPSFVFLHFPLLLTQDVEIRDYGLHPLLRKYKSTIQAVIAGHWHKWYDLGFNFGPRHYAIGSTRYDENAYMLIEADPSRGAHRILNSGCIEWATYRSRPYVARNASK